ncbi:response regulator [Pseudanabaena biceps]|nr:response regulator [Pseudanabaena biceps]
MVRILVIEDEELIRESLEDLLIIEGFQVSTAQDGQHGIQLAIQECPDLIICDVRMPVLNGYQVLEQVRKHKQLSTIPFLFLTSLIDRHSSRMGMALGADDYLEKPCSKNELVEAIAARLGKQKAINQQIADKMDTLRGNITMSLPHELQTPLSGIMGLSELMMMQHEEMLSHEIYEFAQDIYNSAERLHRLIQNYLLYSKLLLLRSQGQERFNVSQPCASKSVISNIAIKKAQECDRLSDLRLDIVEADLAIAHDDLVKIIEELVDNACKYSPKGSPIALEAAIQNGHWLFAIEDHGRGMSQEQIANIGAYMQFDRQFYEQQGIGLGLYIAKTLVEFHDGNMIIESQENSVTRMSLTLPLADSPKE